MNLRDALLPELDQEMAGTRRTLERVPDAKLGWRPHPKSPTLGGLATHLANLPSWTKITLETSELDIAPKGAPPPRAGEKRSRDELLAFFDENLAAARAALAKATDGDLQVGWTLLKGGERVFTLPRIAALRGFVLNHNVHHRAQLGVYLRLLDVPVPALYGPTADEPGV